MNGWFRIFAGGAVFGAAVAWGWVVYLTTGSTARVRSAVSRIMAGPLCRTLLMDVRVHGLEHLEGLGPCIAVANHQSNADQALLSNVYRHFHEMAVMGKMSGWWSFPPIAYLYRRTGNIVVTPGKTIENAQAIRLARATLERGASVGLYPEGTRRTAEPLLGPFQLGGFSLAIKMGVPIVPVVVSTLAPEFDLTVPRVQPQTVHIHVLAPEPTQGLTPADARRLSEETRARMQQILDAGKPEG